MQGRGEKYEKTNDTLRKILDDERNLPIDNLLVPRASVKPSNKGSENKNFMLWIDVPSFRKDEIKEVQYTLCSSYIDPIRISNDPSSSFAIGYLEDGFCPNIYIDVILKSGKTIELTVSFVYLFLEQPDL